MHNHIKRISDFHLFEGANEDLIKAKADVNEQQSLIAEEIAKQKETTDLKEKAASIRNQARLVGQMPALLNALANAIDVYPNPTNGLINIAGTDISNIKEISIFNQLGQKVMNLNASQLNNNSFDISDLNTGVYFAQLKDNSNNSKTMKIVKE